MARRLTKLVGARSHDDSPDDGSRGADRRLSGDKLMRSSCRPERQWRAARECLARKRDAD